MSRGERIIVSGLLILTLLLSTIPLTSASESKSERDYVTYTTTGNYSLTIIEGMIVDNETREPIENARVTGEVRSKTIPIELETNKLGKFRVVPPRDLAPGTHQFQLTASSIGYDNKTVVGEIKQGEDKRITIELDYNPFDLALNPENSSYTGEWVDNTYENTVVENFIATRKVLAGYRWVYFQEVLSSISRIHLIRAAGKLGWKFGLPNNMREFFGVDKSWPSHYFYYKDGFTTDDYYVRYEEGYFKWAWPYREWEVVNESKQRVHPAFYYWCRTGETYKIPLNYFELCTHPNSTHVKIIRKWMEPGEKIQGKAIYNHEFGWYGVEGGTHGLFRYMPSSSWRYCSRKLPNYKEEEYTRYRTTVYEIKDHQFENQGSLQSKVILTPHNGYDNVIRLEIEPKSAKAELESTTLTPSSPCSTTLNTETPTGGTHEKRAIGVRAYDVDGRLVETRTFRLNIQVPEKPPVENTVLRTAESDTKPPESGDGAVDYETIYGGVAGTIRAAYGLPIRSATVRAWEDGSYIGSKSSCSDGRYCFQRIMGTKDSNGNYYGVKPSYEYNVYVHKDGYRRQWRHGTWKRGMEDLPVGVNFYLLPESV